MSRRAVENSAKLCSGKYADTKERKDTPPLSSVSSSWSRADGTVLSPFYNWREMDREKGRKFSNNARRRKDKEEKEIVAQTIAGRRRAFLPFGRKTESFGELPVCEVLPSFLNLFDVVLSH